MATKDAQHKWRLTHRFVKRQLNVMAREVTHTMLAEYATRFGLRGKGEAVTFNAFVMEALIQRGAYSDEARAILKDAEEAYHRDRDLYIN